MNTLKVLLTLACACLALAQVRTGDEIVPGSYMFAFSEKYANDAATKQRVYQTVMELLQNKDAIRNEFIFDTIGGFFLFDVKDDQYKTLNDRLTTFGSLQPNTLFKLDLPSDEQAPPSIIANPIPILKGRPNCIKKRCCGRVVNYAQNSNLDWLDGKRDGLFCSPTEECDKLDVFVLDTGVDKTHPDFMGRVKTTMDCSVSGPAPWTPFLDIFGHGTHVAGTIASETFGVTPNVNINSIKVLNNLGSGTNANIVCGLNTVASWLTSNPTKRAIVSMSLGYFGVNPTMNTIMTNFANTYANRLVVVVAAGNNAKDACTSTFASVTPVVAVGSVNAALAESWFSNFGKCVDILAPGETILSTYPSNQNTTMSGTSMATPLVTGTIAQYWVENPTLTGLGIRTSITSATSPLHAAMLTARNAATPNKLVRYLCPGKCCFFDPLFPILQIDPVLSIKQSP